MAYFTDAELKEFDSPAWGGKASTDEFAAYGNIGALSSPTSIKPGLTAKEAIAKGGTAMGDLYGTLGSGLSTKAFSDWYADPKNAAMFDNLDEAEMAKVSSNFSSPDANASIMDKWGQLGMKDQISAGLGAAQFGLGLAGYLDQTKTAKKQRELMGQQIASNRDLLATRKERAGDISKAFGGGLAATTI